MKPRGRLGSSVFGGGGDTVADRFVVLSVMYIRRPVPDQRLVSFVIPPSESGFNTGTPVISPNGRTIAFKMAFDGRSLIYVRELGSLAEQRINGTEDAGGLFCRLIAEQLLFLRMTNSKR